MKDKYKILVYAMHNLFTVKKSQSFWNVTVVGIEFSIDQQFIFSKLLNIMRLNYFKNIKEKKNQKYKKAKFI